MREREAGACNRESESERRDGGGRGKGTTGRIIDTRIARVVSGCERHRRHHRG